MKSSMFETLVTAIFNCDKIFTTDDLVEELDKLGVETKDKSSLSKILTDVLMLPTTTNGEYYLDLEYILSMQK